MTTDWNSLLTTKRNVSTVNNFAKGNLSGKEFYSTFAGTPNGGIVRTLLRDHGVNKSRTLAQKALSRRVESNS